MHPNEKYRDINFTSYLDKRDYWGNKKLEPWIKVKYNKWKNKTAESCSHVIWYTTKHYSCQMRKTSVGPFTRFILLYVYICVHIFQHNAVFH
jgi:hypothetical protein